MLHKLISSSGFDYFLFSLDIFNVLVFYINKLYTILRNAFKSVRSHAPHIRSLLIAINYNRFINVYRIVQYLIGFFTIRKSDRSLRSDTNKMHFLNNYHNLNLKCKIFLTFPTLLDFVYFIK